MKIVTIGIIGLVIVSFVGFRILTKPHQGKINETWETSNNTLKIRVTAYAEENGGFVPGAYYVFRSVKAGSDDWHEVMTFRNDDPVPIPKDQVRFANDEMAYFFMIYKYAITTDGGRTWLVRNIVTDIPDWKQNRPSIKDMRIAPDGSGTMELTSSTNQEARPLHTKDYGRHWSAE